VNTVKSRFFKGNAVNSHHSPVSAWWHERYSTGLLVKTSDAVETVISEIETWLKLRDRDFAMKAETETSHFSDGN